MHNNLVFPLNKFFPEVREFSHTKIHYAKPFVPSFEDKGWTSILYIEKGNFEIRYETGEILTPKGGTFYYHPPLSLKYQTSDKTITPYSMFRLALELPEMETPGFSSACFQEEIIGQLPSRPFSGKASPLMITSFNTIVEEYDCQRPGWIVQVENAIRQILISAIRGAREKDDAHESHWLVEKVNRFLADNRDYMGPVEDLFEQLGVTRSQGYDIFHRSTGLNPKEYILRKKIELAKQMLKQNRDITTIAFDLGFSSSQNFATVFRKLTCSTPSEYRKNILPGGK